MENINSDIGRTHINLRLEVTIDSLNGNTNIFVCSTPDKDGTFALYFGLFRADVGDTISA